MTTPDATLAAIDDALEQGRVTLLDPDERELQELALALRAEAPRPTAEFEARLERQLAAGFPRERRFKFDFPRAQFLAIGTAAAALIAIVLVVSSGGGSGGSSAGTSGTPASGVAEGKANTSQMDSAGSAASAAPRNAVPAIPTERPRRVERSASLTLGAPADKLESVANDVIAVTDHHNGFVLHSSVTSGSGDAGGSFDLRVPSGQLQSTLADLSKLANVRSRTQNASDITSSYNGAADRLAAARALRQSLLRQLAAATTVTQADALRHRIKLVSAQIRTLSDRFAAVQRRAQLASIQVDLVKERAKHAAAAGGLGGDFHDAVGTLADSFGIALRVLGVAIPLAIVAALGWLAAGFLKRRRREAVLTQS
jgi:Domain of unknown function (DUF4349)